MAIVISDISSEAGWSLDGGRTYTVKLLVESDATIGGKAAIDACNLWEGTSYRFPMVETETESDDRAFLQDVQTTARDPDGLVWELSLKFGARNPANDSRGPIDEDGRRDPFAARPQLRGQGEYEEVAITRDRNGDPILNSAGDPFDPPLTVPVPALVYDVQRVERFSVQALIMSHQGRVNDDVWLGWPAGSVLCRSISESSDWNADAGGTAWTVTYQFAFRDPILVGSDTILPGWAVQVLDAGMRQKVSGVKKQILVDNAPVSSPVPLKSDGTAAAPSDAPHYLAFDVYPEADFDALDMPSDLFTAGTPEV